MAYLGQGAEGNFTTTNAKDTFSGDGSETTFTLSQRGTENNVDVFVNNVRQEPGVAYNIEGNGTSLVFTAAPSTGTNNIYVVNRGPAELSASHPASQNLEAADGTFTGDLTVDTSTLKVDSTNNRVGIGTSSPREKLDVIGDVIIESAYDGTQFIRNVDVASVGLAGHYIGIGAKYNGNPVTPVVLAGSTDSDGTAGSFSIRLDDSEKMRILSGGGLTFNGDTAAANALDDYEEGTWTPTLGGSSSNPTVSYSSLRSGTYVKIGKLVYCTFIMDISSRSGGSGTALISGLPYTAENNNASYGNQPLLIDRLAGDYRQVSSQTEPNQSYAVMIRNAGSTGSHSGVDVSTLANMSCRGTIIYRAS